VSEFRAIFEGRGQGLHNTSLTLELNGEDIYYFRADDIGYNGLDSIAIMYHNIAVKLGHTYVEQDR